MVLYGNNARVWIETGALLKENWQHIIKNNYGGHWLTQHELKQLTEVVLEVYSKIILSAI